MRRPGYATRSAVGSRRTRGSAWHAMSADEDDEPYVVIAERSERSRTVPARCGAWCGDCALLAPRSGTETRKAVRRSSAVGPRGAREAAEGVAIRSARRGTSWSAGSNPRGRRCRVEAATLSDAVAAGRSAAREAQRDRAHGRQGQSRRAVAGPRRPAITRRSAGPDRGGQARSQALQGSAAGATAAPVARAPEVCASERMADDPAGPSGAPAGSSTARGSSGHDYLARRPAHGVGPPGGAPATTSVACGTTARKTIFSSWQAAWRSTSSLAAIPFFLLLVSGLGYALHMSPTASLANVIRSARPPDATGQAARGLLESSCTLCCST